MTIDTNKLAFYLDATGQKSEQTLWVGREQAWHGAAFVQRVEAWTRALSAQGAVTDEVVAVSLPPSVDLFASVLAIWRLGGAVFLLPPNLSLDESLRWMQSAESTGGIVCEELAQALAQQEESFSWRWGIVHGTASFNGWPLLEDVLQQTDSQHSPALAPWDASRRAVISLSAGAWQPPLGVVMTQGQIWAAIESLAQDWQRVALNVEAGLLDLPLSCTLLQVGFGLSLGGAQLNLNPASSWPELVQVAQQHNSAVCLTTFRRITEWTPELSNQTENPQPLQWLWALGGLLTKELIQQWSIPLRSAYKIEACGGIVAWSTDDKDDVGRLLPGLDYRVEREPHQQQRHRRPGEPLRGEILLRGTQVSTERLDAESRFFHIESALPGWLSTGDWGFLDRNKHLHIEGHVEDIVEYRDGYFSIRPIEEQLCKHPQILDAVLCKVDRDKKLKAFVEIDTDAPGRPLTSRTVLAYLQEHFPHYMHPRFVEFRDKLPRNLYGRVARWKLK